MALYSDLSIAEENIPSKNLKDDQNDPILLFLSTTKTYTEAYLRKLYLLLIRYYNGFIPTDNAVTKLSIIVVN